MSWKQTKYKAIPCTIDGIRFHSLKEGARYKDLKLMEQAGEIVGLQLQVRYPLVVNGTKIGSYVCDFRYETPKGIVVEDVKGYRTVIYRLKKKLMKAIYNIDIMET
jgi:hypothetical protein